jgi:hypothetical protein
MIDSAMESRYVKDLFDPTLADDVKQRMMRLQPESAPGWGKMTVAQTLAHCTAGIQMATGIINPRRASFPANVLGVVIKPLALGDDKPMRRNSPTSAELIPADPAQCDFERERRRLTAAIDAFVSDGPVCCSRHPHPFFGPLKPQQWAILMYKHVDHHLRQFGV